VSAGRSTDRVERDGRQTPQRRGDSGKKANDSFVYRRAGGRRRLSNRYLIEVEAELSARDLALLRDLRRLRVLTGSQLERLHFADIEQSSRARTRRRVLGRLGAFGLVATLGRRIGGVRSGSSGLIYALSGAGQRLLDGSDGQQARRREPHTPGALFLGHALAISELYVKLKTAGQVIVLVTFDAERDAIWTDHRAYVHLEQLRPDALVTLSDGTIEDVWWIEIDRATESLPSLKAKLQRYAAFVRRGVPGPFGVIPRLLVTVPSDHRRYGVESIRRQLTTPDDFLHVVLEAEAADYLVSELLSGEIEKPP
jgi:hypothetical protein